VGFSYCVPPCETADTCYVTETCVPEGVAGLQDFAFHCFINTCAPGGGIYNNMQDTEWLAPCNVIEVGDGYCLGPYNNGTENFGYCYATRGGAALGEDCLYGSFQGEDLSCAEGFCAYGLNKCVSTCTVDDGIACSETGDSSCYPLAATNGICYPAIENAPGLGEPCNTDSELMPCGDDLLCGYPNGDLDEDMACVEICDSQAPVGGAASCQEGQTCYVYDAENNPRAGVCITF